ncbi:glycosyltransferase family 39 protein [Nocardia seriolae]|uniref:glycosyltransferase family 39 protein n=1 Tax=Nocardia seriolae TaxID=37332 RepID=UPI001192CDDB|nr:glycosyltransferase family 39 protein [Nocardia seriolae]GEM28856.1 glycosyl transferase family 39 [Nocardia seriolae NBRC 15557]
MATTGTVTQLGTVEPVAERAAFAWKGVLAVSFGFAAIMGIAAARINYFGDELYFVAAGRRLAWAYPDQGPLAPFVAHLMDSIAPGSVLALRIPALALMAAAAVISAATARALGAGARYQVLAALAYAVSPLAFDQIQLITLTFDIPLQALIVYLLIRWVRARQDWLLIAAGVAAAVAFQAKWMVPGVWAMLGIGVLVAGPREVLRRPALYIGTLIMVVAMVPGIIWQTRHGWVESQMTEIISQEQHAANTGPLICAIEIAIQCGLIGGLLSLLGLWGMARLEPLRPYRFALIAGLLLVLVVLVENGRSYYVAGFWPALLGAGAFTLSTLEFKLPARRLVNATAVVSAIAFALWMVAIPLPKSWIPLPKSLTTISTPITDQAQYWMRESWYGPDGYATFTAAVNDAVKSLPESERTNTAVVAAAYVQASALEEFGRKYDLPPVYSPNRGFGYFGPPPDSAHTIIYLSVDGVGDKDFLSKFATTTEFQKINNPNGLPGLERLITVYICHNPLRPWSETWPGLQTLTFPSGI